MDCQHIFLENDLFNNSSGKSINMVIIRLKKIFFYSNSNI